MVVVVVELVVIGVIIVCGDGKVMIVVEIMVVEVIGGSNCTGGISGDAGS